MRKYEPRDLEVIMDIGNRAWKPIYAMFRSIYGDELFGVNVPDEATEKGRQIRCSCSEHPELVMVCERNGRVIGFITLLLDRTKGVGEIGNNAVDPLSGERGAGQEMYRAALDFFKSEGMRYAKVTTGMDESHAPARRAYERAGFKIHHENITYYQKV